MPGKHKRKWIAFILILAMTACAVPTGYRSVQASEIGSESAGNGVEQSADLEAEENAVALASDTSESTDWIRTPDTANKWQIVVEGYNGRGQLYKDPYDIDNDGVTDIFYQKNVVPTGVENEFLVYMGISKRMSWDEILSECDLLASPSGTYGESDIGTLVDDSTHISGNTRTIYPGESNSANNFEATVTYTRGGKTVATRTAWYHSTEQPKCNNGTALIHLKQLHKYLFTAVRVNFAKTGGKLTYTIPLDTLEKSGIYFSTDAVSADSVEDTMGNYMTYESVVHADGTYSYEDNSKKLIWKPVSNGVEGIQTTDEGGLTGYYYNAYQLVYKVHLNTEQTGFHSCAQNMDSTVEQQESYPVNQKATLQCSIKGTSASGSVDFQVPYVRGLLYNLEFQKVIEDSKIPLSGVTFKVERISGGDTYAEKLTWTDTAQTGTDGWIKFRKLPWGTYKLTEVSYKDGDDFQNKYMDSGNIGKTHIIQIGKVINPKALSEDHETGHLSDEASDANNMLFLYNSENAGVMENAPNRATITIVKEMDSYDSLSTDLKNQKYTINTTSSGSSAVYMKPDSTQTDSDSLSAVNQTASLGHQDTVTYDLIVPDSGGVIDLKEVIPEAVRDKVNFSSAEVTENTGSTGAGTVTDTEQGCQISVLPGNNLTVTITNSSGGTVQIRKVVDNYENYQGKLSGDAFIITAVSADDNGAAVNVQMVLQNGETSPVISINKQTTLNISEALPKEYSLSSVEVSGGGSVNGNQVMVTPGEHVVITVHNTYSGKHYFHVSDAIKNSFKRK